MSKSHNFCVPLKNIAHPIYSNKCWNVEMKNQWRFCNIFIFLKLFVPKSVTNRWKYIYELYIIFFIFFSVNMLQVIQWISSILFAISTQNMCATKVIIKLIETLGFLLTFVDQQYTSTPSEMFATNLVTNKMY